VLCLLVFAPGLAAQSGGIELFAGETLFAEGTRVSFTSLVEHSDSLRSGTSKVADPADLSFTERREVLGLDHGLHKDLTVSMLVPWVSKRFSSTAGALRADGLGDVALMTKWRFHQDLRELGTTHFSLVTGVEAPTGETREKQGGVRLPPGVQPGSGSWDPFAALVTTRSQGLWRLDGMLFHKLNRTGDQGLDRGDLTVVEGAVAYRFWHERYPGPTASARVGLQWRHEERDRVNGSKVLASGSEELLLRTGLGFHPTPAWDVSLSLDVPLRQDVRATQLTLDSRLKLAVGLRF
jgi:hypothetical protein